MADASEAATVVSDAGSGWDSAPVTISAPPRPRRACPAPRSRCPRTRSAISTPPIWPASSTSACSRRTPRRRADGTRGARGDPPGPRPSNRSSPGSLRGVRLCDAVGRHRARLGVEGGSGRRGRCRLTGAAPGAYGGCFDRRAGASRRGAASGGAQLCRARVTTTPAGAAVFWGDTALGSSPIRHAAVPCGTATVTPARTSRR